MDPKKIPRGRRFDEKPDNWGENQSQMREFLELSPPCAHPIVVNAELLGALS
jgi:hypothetical protein